MTTADEFTWQLSKYVGYEEQPLGSNNVPGITDVCGCNAAWCAWCYMTLSVAMTSAGTALNEWSVPAGVAKAKRGEDGYSWVDDVHAGEIGDFIVFNFPGGLAHFDHIGGIVGVLAPGVYHTVEGNVDDRCKDQIRRAANGYIDGFIRPPYTDDEEAELGAAMDEIRDLFAKQREYESNTQDLMRRLTGIDDRTAQAKDNLHQYDSDTQHLIATDVVSRLEKIEKKLGISDP